MSATYCASMPASLTGSVIAPCSKVDTVLGAEGSHHAFQPTTARSVASGRARPVAVWLPDPPLSSPSAPSSKFLRSAAQRLGLRACLLTVEGAEPKFMRECDFQWVLPAACMSTVVVVIVAVVVVVVVASSWIGGARLHSNSRSAYTRAHHW